MRPSRKISPWILPPIGFILGILYAFMIIYGVVAAWHSLGNPGEKIVRIIGMKEGSRIIVSTETGKKFI